MHRSNLINAKITIKASTIIVRTGTQVRHRPGFLRKNRTVQGLDAPWTQDFFGNHSQNSMQKFSFVQGMNIDIMQLEDVSKRVTSKTQAAVSSGKKAFDAYLTKLKDNNQFNYDCLEDIPENILNESASELLGKFVDYLFKVQIVGFGTASQYLSVKYLRVYISEDC